MHNKLLITFIFLITSSCAQRQYHHTEVICPKLGTRVLVRFSEAKDVKVAIENALKQKIKDGSSEQYTAIILKDGRSMAIKKVPPEEAMKCHLREIPAYATSRQIKSYTIGRWQRNPI